MLGLHWDHAFHALHVLEKREGRRGSCDQSGMIVVAYHSACVNRDGRGDRDKILNCLKFFHASDVSQRQS